MGDRHICQPCQQGLLQDYKSKLEQLRSALSGVAVYHDKIDQTELYNILKTNDITIMPDTIQLLQAILYNNSRVHEVEGWPPASSYIRHRILIYGLAGDFTKK